MHSDIDINTHLQFFLDDINNNMNSHFTIINSKGEKNKEKFQSEKLIKSLISTGISINLSIKLLEYVTNKIIQNHDKKTLTTSEIREIVRNSLYSISSIDGIEVDHRQCQIWGDVYLRKYGNPDGPIEIVHIDGDYQNLDYDFLEKEVIPEVLSEIMRMEKSEISKYVPNKEIVSMGNELMRAITELGIYKMSHRALLLLTKEIAIQPPHPWVIDPNNSFDYVSSDVTKASTHMKDAQLYYNEGNFSYCKNSILECVHHTSSAILGYYNEFYGCDHLSTFYNLINVTKKIVKGKESELFKDSKIILLKNDINFCEMSLLDFSDLLKKIKRNLQTIYNDDALEEILPLLNKYVNICETLTSGRSYLIKELEHSTEIDDERLKGKVYEDTVKKILDLADCFTIKSDVHLNNKQFDLVIEHRCKRETFSEIKKYIFVECKNRNKKTDIEVIEKLGKRIEEKSDRLCNTGIVVSAKGFTKGAISEALKYLDKGTFIILLKNIDLYGMIEGDVIKELETKINILFYGLIDVE